MNQKAYRAVVIVAVIVVAGAAIAWKMSTRADTAAPEVAVGMPTVLDFGMGQCEACKKMKPILDKLAAEYDGRATIRIIDIGDHPSAADEHGIKLIPTQIFIDGSGAEVSRHEGFMPRGEIVAKLRAMGVE